MKRTYLALLAAWLIVAALGSVAGAVHDGVRSILPNFFRYGLGVGAIIAVILAIAYFFDRRLEK